MKFLGNLQQHYRTKVTFLIVLLLILCVSWGLYALFGHGIIEDAYDGKSVSQINNLIQYQYKKPVEHYLALGDHLFYAFLFGTFLFFIALFLIEEIIIRCLKKWNFSFSEKHVRILLYSSLLIRLFFAAFTYKCWNVGDEGYYWKMYEYLTVDLNLSLTALRPPLWGYLLIIPNLIFDHAIGGRFLNSFIGALSPLFVYLLGDKLFNKKTAFWAGLLYAVYPTHIAFSHYLWSEVLFGLLALLGLNLFFRYTKHENKKYFQLSFLVLGFSLLTKEFTLVFFISLMVTLFFMRKNVKQYISQVMIGSVCFFLPAVIYSAGISILLNRIVLLNESPVSNFRQAVGLGDGAFVNLPQDNEKKMQFTKEFLSYYFNRPLPETISSFKKQFFNLWTPNSFPVVRLCANNPPTQYGWAYGFEIRHGKFIVGVIVASYVLIIILGLTGLCLADVSPFSCFSTICLLALSSLSAFCFLCSRFRLPFMFIFILFATDLVLHHRKYLKNMRNPKRMAVLLILLTIFVMILIDKFPILGEWG